MFQIRTSFSVAVTLIIAYYVTDRVVQYAAAPAHATAVIGPMTTSPAAAPTAAAPAMGFTPPAVLTP
jgi:hypothetical protein